MYDPEDKKNDVRPRSQKLSVRQDLKKQDLPKPAPKLMSELERLRYYLINDPGTRAFYGFEIEKVGDYRYLKISDLKKLERQDFETKAILREIYKELKKPEYY